MRIFDHTNNHIITIGACWEVEIIEDIIEDKIRIYAMAKIFDSSKYYEFPIARPSADIINDFKTKQNFFLDADETIEIVMN